MPEVRALIRDTKVNAYMLLEGRLVSIERDLDEEDLFPAHGRIPQSPRETVSLTFVRTREIQVTEEWVHEHMHVPEPTYPSAIEIADDYERLMLEKGGETYGI